MALGANNVRSVAGDAAGYGNALSIVKRIFTAY